MSKAIVNHAQVYDKWVVWIIKNMVFFLAFPTFSIYIFVGFLRLNIGNVYHLQRVRMTTWDGKRLPNGVFMVD